MRLEKAKMFTPKEQNMMRLDHDYIERLSFACVSMPVGTAVIFKTFNGTPSP